jgi:hypothetical protein
MKANSVISDASSSLNPMHYDKIVTNKSSGLV